MTPPQPPALKALLPSPSLFYHGKLPEALSGEIEAALKGGE